MRERNNVQTLFHPFTFFKNIKKDRTDKITDRPTFEDGEVLNVEIETGKRNEIVQIMKVGDNQGTEVCFDESPETRKFFCLVSHEPKSLTLQDSRLQIEV